MSGDAGRAREIVEEFWQQDGPLGDQIRRNLPLQFKPAITELVAAALAVPSRCDRAHAPDEWEAEHNTVRESLRLADALEDAYAKQVEHTNLVRAEYQKRIADLERQLGRLTEERDLRHYVCTAHVPTDPMDEDTCPCCEAMVARSQAFEEVCGRLLFDLPGKGLEKLWQAAHIPTPPDPPSVDHADLIARAVVGQLRLRVEAAERALEEARGAIPTTWLDPLLSGASAALHGSGPWGCPDIERLLAAIQKRITAALRGATP